MPASRLISDNGGQTARMGDFLSQQRVLGGEATIWAAQPASNQHSLAPVTALSPLCGLSPFILRTKQRDREDDA